MHGLHAGRVGGRHRAGADDHYAVPELVEEAHVGAGLARIARQPHLGVDIQQTRIDELAPLVGGAGVDDERLALRPAAELVVRDSTAGPKP